MTIRLSGAPAVTLASRTVIEDFVADVTARGVAADVSQTVAVVTDDATEGELIATLLAECGAESRLVVLTHGRTGGLADLAECDAIILTGTRADRMRDAIEPVFAEIRRRVADGQPYLGYGAGTALAAERAIVSGFRIGGVTVCPAVAFDQPSEVTIAPGIGLIDIGIDGSAAERGTLGRLIALTEAAELGGGIALDETVVLVVADGELRVTGCGSAWQILPGERGVQVSTIGAS